MRRFNNVKRMDAHGGWIATPSDLLRVLVRVDRFNTVPDGLLLHLLETLYRCSRASGGGYEKGGGECIA